MTWLGILLVVVAWCSVSLPCALLVSRWIAEKNVGSPMIWRAPWHRLLPR